MDLAGARKLIASQKLVPLVRTGKLVSLADAIAGEPVKGSWWGHRAGKEIFRIASELEDDESVLVMKLLDTKITFVDEALFAPLYRIVTDEGWRAGRDPGITKRAPVEDKKVKAALEKQPLVRLFQEHTDSGKHATFAEPWPMWASKETKAAAKKLTLAAAQDAIRTSSGGIKTPLT